MARFAASARQALARSVVVAILMISMLAGVLWIMSCLTRSVGIFSLGNDTSLRFTRGMAEVHHFYEYGIGPAVPEAQWHTTAVGRGWAVPPPPMRWGLTGVHFTSGLVSGMSGPDVPSMVSPARYWLLHVLYGRSS